MDIIRGCKSGSSLLKIKAAQGYVLGVKKTRVFFLGALLVLVCFMFLLNGLSLIQTAVFTYSMWSSEVKFAVALFIGGVELVGAVCVLIYLFREETWGRFFGIDKVINAAIEQEDRDI